jgi:hypothetical protein
MLVGLDHVGIKTQNNIGQDIGIAHANKIHSEPSLKSFFLNFEPEYMDVFVGLPLATMALFLLCNACFTF